MLNNYSAENGQPQTSFKKNTLADKPRADKHRLFSSPPIEKTHSHVVPDKVDLSSLDSMSFDEWVELCSKATPKLC